MTESQNRDLWFTLPPQQSLLVLWIFSAIPIPILKFLIFYSSSIYYSAALFLSQPQAWYIFYVYNMGTSAVNLQSVLKLVIGR